MAVSAGPGSSKPKGVPGSGGNAGGGFGQSAGMNSGGSGSSGSSSGSSGGGGGSSGGSSSSNKVEYIYDSKGNAIGTKAPSNQTMAPNMSTNQGAVYAPSMTSRGGSGSSRKDQSTQDANMSTSQGAVFVDSNNNISMPRTAAQRGLVDDPTAMSTINSAPVNDFSTLRNRYPSGKNFDEDNPVADDLWQQEVSRRQKYQDAMKPQGIGMNSQGIVTATSAGYEDLIGTKLTQNQAFALTVNPLTIEQRKTASKNIAGDGIVLEQKGAGVGLISTEDTRSEAQRLRDKQITAAFYSSGDIPVLNAMRDYYGDKAITSDAGQLNINKYTSGQITEQEFTSNWDNIGKTYEPEFNAVYSAVTFGNPTNYLSREMWSAAAAQDKADKTKLGFGKGKANTAASKKYEEFSETATVLGFNPDITAEDYVKQAQLKKEINEQAEFYSKYQEVDPNLPISKKDKFSWAAVTNPEILSAKTQGDLFKGQELIYKDGKSYVERKKVINKEDAFEEVLKISSINSEVAGLSGLSIKAAKGTATVYDFIRPSKLLTSEKLGLMTGQSWAGKITLSAVDFVGQVPIYTGTIKTAQYLSNATSDKKTREYINSDKAFEARKQAYTKEEDSLNVVESIPYWASSQFSTKRGVYNQEVARNLIAQGYEGEELDALYNAQMRFRGATDLAETFNIFGISKTSEAQGRLFVAGAESKYAQKFGATALAKANFGTRFGLAFKNIAPAGFFEGATQEYTTQISRAQARNYKDVNYFSFDKQTYMPSGVLTMGVAGALSAGTLGGVVYASGTGSKIIKFRGKNINIAEKSSNVLQNALYLTDVAEKPGDYLEDLAEAGIKSRKLGKTVRRSTFKIPVTTLNADSSIIGFSISTDVRQTMPSFQDKVAFFGNSNTRTRTDIFINQQTQSDIFSNQFVKTPVNTKTQVGINPFMPVTTPVSTNVPEFVPINSPVQTQTPVQTPVNTPVNVFSNPFGFPIFGGMGAGGSGRSGRGSKRGLAYMPDLRALVLNQKAKKGTKKQSAYSGLERRYIL